MGFLLVALDSHFGGLGAVFGHKIEDFVEMCKICKNLRKTKVFGGFGDVRGRFLEIYWLPCGPFGPILNQLFPS